ncbi:MAG: hypothetical protein COT84_04445 [Chlamydiae bacterium CG10_big_fil_rev_8_21_14_0_10_35_9]|nr:MAG: hypothetical protein COT84_04445 [Chlamydiae bacterium CG10_big_fil_rev_8_21_14_0_10_35_9]
MNNAIYLILRLILVFSFLLHGCTFERKEQNSITLNIDQEIVTLDPRIESDLVSNQIYNLLYRSLVKIDSKGNLENETLQSFQLSRDKKTYRFKLKKTFFSDGSLLTAKDFENSWKKVLSPEFPSHEAYLLFSIKGAKQAKLQQGSIEEVHIKSIDDFTLEVRLEKEDPHFLEKLASPIFSPVKPGVFNGPYILKSWKLRDHLVLTKNPYFYDQKNVSIHQIKIYFMQNSSALQLFLNQEVDLIGFPFSALPLSSLSKIDEKYTAITKKIFGAKLLSFNHDGLFKDKLMRKALSYTINRKEIVQKITQTTEGYDLDFFKSTELLEKYHPEKIRNTLDLLPSPQDPITLLYHDEEVNHLIAQQLKEGWEKLLPIKVKLQKMELSQLRERLKKKDYDVCLISWIGEYFCIEDFLERLSDKNHFKNDTGWESNIYQSSLASKDYTKAISIINEEEPIVFLHQYTFKMYHQPNLQNIEISPNGIVYLENVTKRSP